MKRIFSIVAMAVIIFTASIGSAAQMPISNGNYQTISNSIIQFMAHKAPWFYLTSSSQNSLIFEGDRKELLSDGHYRYMFTISQSSDGSYLVNLVAQVNTTGFLGVNDGYYPVNNHDPENLLVYIKGMNDGFYVFGFEANKYKIKSVDYGGGFYKAGISAGDTVKKLFGYKITTDLMGIIGCESPITLTISHNGEEREVTAYGEYITPEEYTKQIFSY